MADDKMDMKLNFDIKVNDLKELDKIETEILTFVQGLNKADEKSKGLAKSLSGVGKILDAINKRRKSAEDAQLKALELQLEQNKAAQKGLVTERDRARTEAQRSKIAQRERELEHNASRLQEDIAARMERRQVRMQREAKQARQQADREERAAEKERKRTSDYLWNLRQRSARLEAAQAKSETQVENRRARAARQTRDTVASVNQFLNRQVRMLAYKGEIEERANTQAMKNLRSQTAAALVQQRADIRRAKEKGVYDKAEEQRIQERFTQTMKMARRSYNADVALGRAEQQRQNAIHRNRMRNEREFQREQERARNDAVRGAMQIGGGVTRLASQGRNAGLATAGLAYGGERAVKHGVSSHMSVDTAATNLRIFSSGADGQLSWKQIQDVRDQWSKKLAVSKGMKEGTVLGALADTMKGGIDNLDVAKQVTEEILKNKTTLEMSTEQATQLAGNIWTKSSGMSNDKRLSTVKDAMFGVAIAAQATNADATELAAAMNRSGDTVGRTGMSYSDVAAFNSAGIGGGMQQGKAGTFLDFLTGDIVGYKTLDPHRKKQLNKGLKKADMGGAAQMAALLTNPATAATAMQQMFDNYNKKSAKEQAEIASLIGMREWRGEFGIQARSNESFKRARKEQKDPKNANWVNETEKEKMNSWEKRWDVFNSVVDRAWDEFGSGFEEIFFAVTDFVKDAGLDGRFSFLSNSVKSIFEGFKEALGVKTWKGFLNDMTGGPGGMAKLDFGKQLKDFAKGFLEGAMSFGSQFKAVVSAFGYNTGSWAEMGKLAGYIATLSLALLALSPVMSVVGALGGVITAVAGAALALKGAAGMAGTLRLLMGGSSMAAIGSMGTGATAAAGWPIVGTLIAAGFLKYISGSGANWIDKKLGINSDNAFSFSGAQRMLTKPLGPIGYAWDYLTGDSKKEEPKGSTTQQVIENTQRQIQELDAIVKSLTPQQQRVLEKIEENTREGATVQKQSFNLQQDSESPFKNLIQKASLGGALGATAGILRDMSGGSLSGGGGGLGARSGGGGGGGPLINSSTPGGSLNGVIGMRRRGIMGGGSGGGGGSSLPSSDGSSEPIAGALNPRLAGSRKNLMDELDRDPALRRDVFKTISMENRGSPLKMQTVLESMVNRSKMNGYTSLRQAIHSGFYGPVNRGGLRGSLSEKDRLDGEAALKQVRGGSNVIGYRTDQGMLTDPGARRYMKEADHSGHKVIAGENFFLMGQKGRAWAKQQEALDIAAGAQAPVAAAKAEAVKMKDLGDGITSSGWKKKDGSAIDANVGTPKAGSSLGSAPLSTTGPSGLGASTPIRPVGGGAGGAGKMGSGGSSGDKIDIHINGHNKDPKELSNEVQRALQNDMNRRTHDYDGFA